MLATAAGKNEVAMASARTTRRTAKQNNLFRNEASAMAPFFALAAAARVEPIAEMALMVALYEAGALRTRDSMRATIWRATAARHYRQAPCKSHARPIARPATCRNGGGGNLYAACRR